MLDVERRHVNAFDELDVAVLRLLANKEVLYQVAQEALHNVVKHANARHVSVSLTNADGAVVLQIRDDRKGFDPAGHFPGHLDLQSMHEQVEGVGRTFGVERAPSAGTNVRATLRTSTAPCPADPCFEAFLLPATANDSTCRRTVVVGESVVGLLMTMRIRLVDQTAI